MRCPYCGNPDTQVKDSRPSEDNTAIRRRRICTDCGGRFTTFERVQLRELMVVKRNQRRVAFDRDKLMRSVQIALRKRQVDPERVDRMVSGSSASLEYRRERGDVRADRPPVMEGLRGLDAVAFVRFASVYRNFARPRTSRSSSASWRRPGGQEQRGLSGMASQRTAESDRRLMAAALRIGRRNLGRTAPNLAVGALIVRHDGDTPVIVGRGWTAEGGWPHAETERSPRQGRRRRRHRLRHA
jgi:transcriptional repressor NrdR